MRAKALVSVRFALAASVVWLMWSGSATGATEKVLHSFNPLPHGSEPSGNLIADASGNLYGTTDFGGTYDQGAVFKLTPNSNGSWTQAVLYSFKGG